MDDGTQFSAAVIFAISTNLQKGRSFRIADRFLNSGHFLPVGFLQPIIHFASRTTVATRNTIDQDTVMKRFTPPFLSVVLSGFLFGLSYVPVIAQGTASKFEIPEKDDGLPGAGPLRRNERFRNLWAQRRSQWA